MDQTSSPLEPNHEQQLQQQAYEHLQHLGGQKMDSQVLLHMLIDYEYSRRQITINEV